MKIRRFFGKDMREALKQVKDELGGDAVIMSNKKVKGGVELVAAVDKETEMSQAAPTISLSKKGKTTPTLSEIIGDDGPDSLKALLEKQQAGQLEDGATQPAGLYGSKSANNTTSPISRQPRASHTTSERTEPVLSATYADSEQAEKRRREAELTNEYVRTPVNKAHDDFNVEAGLSETQASSLFRDENGQSQNDMASIQAELASIRNVLQYQVKGLSDEKSKRHNPTHHYLASKLLGMGISESLIEQMVNFLPPKANETEGWHYLLNLIANRLQIVAG